MPSQTQAGIKLLLASAALIALPSVAHAQLLDTDWSDMDDGADRKSTRLNSSHRT